MALPSANCTNCTKSRYNQHKFNLLLFGMFKLKMDLIKETHKDKHA